MEEMDNGNLFRSKYYGNYVGFFGEFEIWPKLFIIAAEYGGTGQANAEEVYE